MILRSVVCRSFTASAVCLLLACALAAGCGSGVKRVDVDSEDAVMGGISSKDFRSVCMEMSQSLIRLKAIQEASKPPRVAFGQVKNNSDELLDTQSFLDKMRTELLKNSEGKVQFLDREMVKQIMDEKDLKISKLATGNASKPLLGADYFMAGVVTGIRRTSGRESTSYMRFAFRLTDANTSAIVWEQDYEMKFYQKAGLYDR